MKIGASLMVSDLTANAEDVFRKAEALGFDCLVVPEHPIIPVNHKTPYPGSGSGGKIPDWYSHMPDPFVLLGIAAAVTRRIKLMTGVCLVPEHNPLVLAKQAATVDHYSNGRFLFGIGAGWLADETEIMGVNFAKRWAITRECVQAMKELWTKPEASFEGKYIKFPLVRSFPKPAHKPHPPILIGANGGVENCERALKRVVTYGDGWAPLRLSPERLARELGTLKKLCAEAGRDFSQMEITMFRPFEKEGPRKAIEDYSQAGAHRMIVGIEGLYKGGKSLEPGTWQTELEQLARTYLN